MSFNLFAAEEEALAKARALEKRLGALASECLPEFRDLIAAFELSTREQQRLVRVSDRLQAQLSDANHELERRRSEAEAALDRLREAQEAMIQSEKLASLGALVAGVGDCPEFRARRGYPEAKGAPAWHDAKSPLSRMPSSTSCWPVLMPRRRSIRMASSTS